MICKKCSFATCFRHQLPFHEGQSCHEFDLLSDPKKQEQNNASDKEIGISSVPCPSCSVPVMKNGGCDIVKCKYLRNLPEENN